MDKRVAKFIASVWMLGASHASAQSSPFELDQFGLAVDCVQAPEPGSSRGNYTASAHGLLVAGALNESGSAFTVRGEVDVELSPDQFAARSVRVEVRGELNREGDAAWVHVVAPSSSADVEAIYISATANGNSAVVALDPSPTATSKPGYHMSCQASRAKLPGDFVDLAHSNELFGEEASGIGLMGTQAYIAIKNRGFVAVAAATVAIRVGEILVEATLYDRAWLRSTQLQPDEVGILVFSLPRGSLQLCTSYDVTIDSGVRLQSHMLGTPDNDTVALATPCL
jgi:hypothetical protein